MFPQVNPLRPLPSLHPSEEQYRECKYHTPLLIDALVEEDDVVDHGNVQRGHDEDGSADDRPEEERVPPQPVEPRARVGYDAVEEGPTGINQLPAERRKDPHHDGEAHGAGAEDAGAGFGPAQVAVLAEVAIMKTEERRDEGSDHADCHDDTVCKEVGEELGGEDTVFKL